RPAPGPGAGARRIHRSGDALGTGNRSVQVPVHERGEEPRGSLPRSALAYEGLPHRHAAGAGGPRAQRLLPHHLQGLDGGGYDRGLPAGLGGSEEIGETCPSRVEPQSSWAKSFPACIALRSMMTGLIPKATAIRSSSTVRSSSLIRYRWPRRTSKNLARWRPSV